MIIDLHIDALTLGGRGLGRHNGKAVFAPYVAPGDLVRCRIVHDRSRYAEAEVVEVLEGAPERRIPPCPVFGQCGGCQWQHLPYTVQASWKERLFKEQLLRAGVAKEGVFRPIQAAPEEWGYRNRAQFKCHLAKHGLVSGFFRHASHYVIDTWQCPLVMPAIQECYTFIRRQLPAAPRPEAIPQFDLACGDDGNVSILLHVLPWSCDQVGAWWQKIVRTDGRYAAALQSGRKSTIKTICGNPILTSEVDEPLMQLQVSPGGFNQINSAQNRQLVASVVAAASLSGRERVLDLYCGVGNFTLPLARRAAEVVGVESYAPAIADAHANAVRHAIDNVTFFAEGAEGAALRHGTFDVVLLDPPRAGAYPIMKDLLVLRPRQILYVSCDPATLARDLQPLVHHGYEVVSSQPFDLFPQTWHIESLTTLVCTDRSVFSA